MESRREDMVLSWNPPVLLILQAFQLEWKGSHGMTPSWPSIACARLAVSCMALGPTVRLLMSSAPEPYYFFFQ